MKNTFLFIVLLIGYFNYGQAINPFTDEVAALVQKYESASKNNQNIVFTGSSSVRMWTNLEEYFPNHQIINTGFGGSQASDLLEFSEELILKYNPKQVFIYEGDNDVWDKKSLKTIMKNMNNIIAKIIARNQSTKIVLIAAKPSLARWKKRKKYIRLNKKYKTLSDTSSSISYVDVWTPVLINKKPMPDIFIEDGLHMNAKGYDIWYNSIKNFIAQPK